jgi:hypothetical protein
LNKPFTRGKKKKVTLTKNGKIRGAKKKSSKNVKRPGNSKLYISLDSNERRCYKHRAGGRRSEAVFYTLHSKDLESSNCDRLCLKIELGANAYNCGKNSFAACIKCHGICYITGNWILNGNVCGTCHFKEEKASCMICGALKKNVSTQTDHWKSIWVIVDGGRSPMEQRWFCRKEWAFNFVSQSPIWSLPLLQEKIEMKRRQTMKSKRIIETNRC